MREPGIEPGQPRLCFALGTIVVSLSAESFFSKESWALATRYTDRYMTRALTY